MIATLPDGTVVRLVYVAGRWFPPPHAVCAMTVHLPMWALWLVPVLIGMGFVVFSKDESGPMFSLPGPGCFVGVAIIAGTVLVAIGFYIASYGR